MLGDGLATQQTGAAKRVARTTMHGPSSDTIAGSKVRAGYAVVLFSSCPVWVFFSNSL